MAMTLRLNDSETEDLRQKAAEEGRSMQDVAKAAINRYTKEEDLAFRKMVAEIVAEDRELLDRLAQ